MKYLTFLMAFMLLTSCLGNPPSNNNDGNTPDTRKEMQIKSTGTLDERVSSLASAIEKEYSAKTYDETDLTYWTHTILDFSIEYAASISELSDTQCASIEYNFGRIAGMMCNMVSEPLETFSKELEDFLRRREGWENEAERGFKSVIGSFWDF